MRSGSKGYPWYQRAVLKIACTRAGSWLFAHLAPHADRLLFRLSGGRTSLAGLLSGIPVVMLTTTGAHSGLRRTTPVLCVLDQAAPGRFAIIASNFGQKHLPGWYYNLRKKPRAMAEFDGQNRPYIAREAVGEEYARYWQAAIDIYPGYQLYRQWAGRRVPIFVLELEADQQ